MQIDKIREQIAEIISNDIEIWNDVLNNTSPGNYGCNSWEVSIDYKELFVDIPKRTFSIKNGSFSAELILGSSKGEDSMEINYDKDFKANGIFQFIDANNVKIEEITIDIDSDIF